jgi:hypothetical protein
MRTLQQPPMLKTMLKIERLHGGIRRHGRRRWKGSFESPRWRKFPFKRLAFLENLRYANIVYPSSSALLYA